MYRGKSPVLSRMRIVLVPPTANRSFQCAVTPGVPDRARNCIQPTVYLSRVGL